MSKERETFEAWAEREMPLTYKRAILNDVSCAQETRELNFARKGYQAATAHYHPLLAEKDAEIASLKALLEGALGAHKATVDEFKRLKQSVLDDDKVPLMNKIRDSHFLDAVLAVISSKFDEALAAINAATGEK